MERAGDLLTPEVGPQGSRVRVEGLVKHFGPTLAVDHVGFEINAGEALVLLGPSGCGKTTTLRLIAGLEVPDSGHVLIDGEDVTRVPPYHRRLAMVFQSYALFPHLSVADNVGFGLSLRRATRQQRDKRIAELLRLVGLETYGPRHPHQLSGGEQQRVGLARALAVDPRVLLMDEPFGALDRKLRQELQREFRDLHRTIRVTTVFVTHDQEEALLVADRIAVLNHGRVERLGPPAELYDDPRSRFVASFLGEANLFEGSVSQEDAGGLVVRDGGLAIPFSSPPDVDVRLGQDVTVMVRPEFVELVGSSETDGSELRGRAQVRRALHLGERNRFELETEAGRQIVAIRPAPGAPSVREGDIIGFGWPRSAVRLLLN